MTAIVLTVVFVAAAAVLATAVHALVSVVRNDGYYPARRAPWPASTPPRSHPVDEFDPRSRFA